MPEVWFYHLQRQSLEHVLPVLLEKSLERNWRVTVQATSEEKLDALDQWLWTYGDGSFLAHGRPRDGDAEMQPVFLTTGPENPNQAPVRFFIDGASAAPLLESPEANGYARVILLFDGNQEEELGFARDEWKRLKAAGCDLSYWQQSVAGRWEKQNIR
ncbi:DNA polymerase III subunit chi [Methyloferula stellata]|uniref:DNA polymerase III subunit chi n=1 Tax=Methyloferula stellata TaxID=876270 RepID=UPI00037F715D|nr:DNA polymerase III subunit chi [Methyloferula stellata]